jgi:hypothetical protein
MKEHNFKDERDFEDSTAAIATQTMARYFDVNPLHFKHVGSLPEGLTNGYDYTLNRGGQTIRLETKVRRIDYGDFLIEYIDHTSMGLQPVTKGKNIWNGWYFKSKADLLFYIILEGGIPKKAYIISMAKLREAIPPSKLWDYPKKSAKSKTYYTWFVVVPWSDIPHEELTLN